MTMDRMIRARRRRTALLPLLVACLALGRGVSGSANSTALPTMEQVVFRSSISAQPCVSFVDLCQTGPTLWFIWRWGGGRPAEIDGLTAIDERNTTCSRVGNAVAFVPNLVFRSSIAVRPRRQLGGHDVARRGRTPKHSREACGAGATSDRHRGCCKGALGHGHRQQQVAARACVLDS